MEQYSCFMTLMKLERIEYPSVRNFLAMDGKEDQRRLAGYPDHKKIAMKSAL